MRALQPNPTSLAQGAQEPAHQQSRDTQIKGIESKSFISLHKCYKVILFLRI
jgi:hypothetical protein